MLTRLQITLSLEELECIQDQCRQLAESARPAPGFSIEEMQVIREQYESRLQVEAARREDLEWKLEVALAQLHAADPVEEVDQRPLSLAQATPPHGLRIAGRQPRTTPPPLPARARLGSKGEASSELPNLPPPINLAPLRDALLRVAGRREDRATA